jgi:hypothetical protein
MLHLPTKQMRALLGKMELWGTGLFDEAYLELEDIITQAPNQNSIIHGMLLELFTHIIICEGSSHRLTCYACPLSSYVA